MENLEEKSSHFVSLIVLSKAFLFGLLAEGLYCLSIAFYQKLDEILQSLDYRKVLVVSVLLLVTLLLSVYLKKQTTLLKSVLSSKRIDLFLFFGLGIATVFIFGSSTTTIIDKLIDPLSAQQAIILFVVIYAFLVVPPIFPWLYSLLTRKQEEFPFFIPDSEVKTATHDLLDVSVRAKVFAERIFNNGSKESVVFGLDAPWGVGKSSFINFCNEEWDNNVKYKNKVTVFRFNPLRYEDKDNIAEKFIEGLVATIQKDNFVPEIRPVSSRYRRFITGKTKISFLGFDLELSPGTYTIDDAFDDLAHVLSMSKRKIIVVVDDLDRLSYEHIKDVLFSVKKSFSLPNVSYVLCYDSENISISAQNDSYAQKINEFLEKFVNVKISLFVEVSQLKKYIDENLDIVLKGNLQIDPEVVVKVRQTIKYLTEIFDSSEFYKYANLISDIRKIKRLINTLVLLEIQDTDFENSDFNKHDLLHLLLIYINYPEVFRKIYFAETDGKKGMFSVRIPTEDDYDKPAHQDQFARTSDSLYSNTISYRGYISGLTDETQKFLLNKVFNVKERLETQHIDSVAEEISKSYACFNGGPWGGGRNLQDYMYLIVRSTKPARVGQYKFYLNSRDKFAKGESLDVILEEEEFSVKSGESWRAEFWRVLVNSANNLKHDRVKELIDYLVKHFDDYSMVRLDTIKAVGFRDDLDYMVVKLLDRAGWVDESGRYGRNNDENIAVLADMTLGLGVYKGEGVIERLLDPARGVAGLFDALSFRLKTSADRGGETFNLSRALVRHANPSGPTEGNTLEIAKVELREMTQLIFKVFDERYIKTKQNIFAEYRSVDVVRAFGKYHLNIEQALKEGVLIESDLDKSLALAQYRLIVFTVYQLGTDHLGHGVGCGYYDPVGSKDAGGIKDLVTNYFFDVCFNAEISADNYLHFCDYLLMNFVSVFESIEGRGYKPIVKEFCKVLTEEKLSKYWKQNHNAIISMKLTELDREIHTHGYTVNYCKDLQEVFDLLDQEFLKAPESTFTLTQ